MEHLINHTDISIFPSLIFGCGGRGTEAVDLCQQLALQEIFDGDVRKLKEFKPLRFIAVDSQKQNIERDGRQHHLENVSVACEDLIKIIRGGPGYEHILSQMPVRNYERLVRALPSANLGNSTCPPKGAINFIGSWDKIKTRLTAIIEEWKNDTAIHDNTRTINEWNQIFIVASLYGGTGSGIHSHLAAMLRTVLKEREVKNTYIYGIFILPDIIKSADNAGKKKLRANTYACLKEIDYFVAGNPYELNTGRNLITFSHNNEDFLFNRIFLVNDKNMSEERVEINEFEVSQMIGEFIYHASCTTLAENICARLMDTPHEVSIQFAPERKPGEPLIDQRPTFYSTLGLATIRIPYDILKHNLVIDFAEDTLNECLLEPDESDNEDIEKAKITQEKIRNDHLKSSNILKMIKLDDDAINQNLGKEIKLPTMFKTRDTFEEYFDSSELDLSSIVEEISLNASKFLKIDYKSIDFSEYIKDIKESILNLYDQLMNKKGAGKELTNAILSKYRKEINNKHKIMADLVKEIEGSNFIKKTTDILEQIKEHGGKKPLFRKGKQIRKLNKEFRKLKQEINKYNENYLQANILIDICEITELFMKELIAKSDAKGRRYNEIRTEIQANRRRYQTSNLILNPIKEDELEIFIRQFNYPVGLAPENAAQTIKNEGLNIHGQNMKITDFPDYPRETARAIIKMAKEFIDKIDDSIWKEPFTRSSFYPNNISNSDRQQNSQNLNAYKNTFDKLVNHSSPYLEYAQNEGFSSHKEYFFIIPSNPQGDVDLEELEWKKIFNSSLTMGRWQKGKLNHCLTCLQMHHGIPLYSLDEFEEWQQDYNYMLERTDRPLHKFNYIMKEPYIDVSRKTTYNQTTLKALLDWAIDISTEKSKYPIVFMENDIPIINMPENESVMNFYFQRYKAKYIRMGDFKSLLGESEQVQAYIYSQLLLYINKYKDIFKLGYENMMIQTGSNKAETIIKIIDNIKVNPHLPHESLDSEPVFSIINHKDEDKNEDVDIYFSDQNASNPHVKLIIVRYFKEKLSIPVLKKSLSYREVLQKLENTQPIQDALLQKCFEAKMHLCALGESLDDLPDILKDID
ncbi:MAG: hypothetical protein HQK65_01055 [Desulfamplus sp.]|nr:hypothetical protein [Desulfamplus sp.]